MTVDEHNIMVTHGSIRHEMGASGSGGKENCVTAIPLRPLRKTLCGVHINFGSRTLLTETALTGCSVLPHILAVCIAQMNITCCKARGKLSL